MKTPFLDYWTNRKERQELLEKRHRIKLTAAQLSTLLGDSDVRIALQKSRVGSLLPPVGTEVFRRFTPASQEQINKRTGSTMNKQVEEENRLKPAPELESGKTLPFFYGLPPPELRHVPLEDPDPFYQSQKTFVVVDRVNTLARFNAESSCFLFSPFSLFRQAAIKILNHNLFNALLFVVLVTNIFFYLPKGFTWEYILELVFLSVYTFETVLKILSRGFCWGRFTYVRDSWNILDFVIITTGFALFSVKKLWFLKTLRFIKILGLFPATRRNARMFGRVFIKLWDIFLFTLLVLSVFSIIGMSVFSGSLRDKCVLWPWKPTNSTDPFDWLPCGIGEICPEFDYYAYINDKQNHYYIDGEPQICGNLSFSSACPKGYICIRTSTNPDFGFTNFDHFGYSFLATFRLMTRDFWENLAYQAMQAQGQFVMVYFVVVLFICSFSLTAFIVAAFTITFTEQTEEELREAKQDKKDYDKILAALKDKIEDEPLEKMDPGQMMSRWRRVCSCDCCGCWVWFKNGLQAFVLDPVFDMAIIFLIVLYICFLCAIHYPMTANHDHVLTEANLVFTFLFFLEVVLKILAMGSYEFFKVKWHCFDTILVILSIVDLGFAGLSVLALANFLRLFRLGRWWPGLLKWMCLVWAGLCSFWTLSLVLISFFFSMLGMFMFSESYVDNVCRISDDCNLPRWHWNSFFHSFMMVTRAICGEWIETLWLCLETSNKFICVLFYAMLLIVGHFLIFILFLTLLMKWISGELASEDQEKIKTSKMRIIKMLSVCGTNVRGKAKKLETVVVEDDEDVALCCAAYEQTEENGTQSVALLIREAQNDQKLKESEESTEDPEDCCCQKCYSWCPSLNLGESQGCGRVWANLRRAAFVIVQHTYFNNFIFLIVLVSCLALVIEQTRPVLQFLSVYFDQAIMYLFVLEVLFKWIGLGFNSYFRDKWCWLDFMVTLASVLSVAAQASLLNPSLISLKNLRPLRILAYIQSTRNVQKMKETEESTEDQEDCCCQKCYSWCPSLNLGKSQGCGRVWANLRRAAFILLQHPYFNNFIFIIILISCFALMVEHMHPALQYVDQVIMYLFVLEVLFKWIGLGFNRYFRDGWCWLDFIVTLACVLSVAAQSSLLTPSLISLKALRPLRIPACIKGTRRSVCGLLKLVPPLLNVLLVTFTVWVFFAILFIDSYAGKFYHCFNVTSNEIFHNEDVANATECMWLIHQNFTEVRWMNKLFNFDNVFESLLSLLSVATMKGWIDIIQSLTDSTRIEQQPYYETSVYQYLAFLFFQLFGGFFCFIYILKALFDAYSLQTQKIRGSHLFLTEKQMENFNNIGFCSKRPLAPCPRPQGWLRGRLFDLVSRECFEWLMQGVILVGIVERMIERYDMTFIEGEVLHWTFFVLTVIFLLEFMLKICAFRQSYFSDRLNTIDFMVLALQILDICVSEFAHFHYVSSHCLHLLRLGRLTRVVHRFPGALRLRLLFAAWTRSLRAIFNLALLLFTLMLTYASFATFHFSHLQKTGFINDMLNFETFGGSLACMWTVTTWGSWEALLLPTLLTPPYCDPGDEGNCGSPALGVAFFVSYLCLSTFLVLLMALVVLVDMLNLFAEMHSDPLSVVNLSHFFQTWRKFAPDSSHFIQRSQLPDLCDKLKKPLGIPKDAELELEPSPEEEVHCREVLLALSALALEGCANRDVLRARINEKYHEFMPDNPSQKSCEMTDCPLQRNQEDAATRVTEELEE